MCARILATVSCATTRLVALALVVWFGTTGFPASPLMAQTEEVPKPTEFEVRQPPPPEPTTTSLQPAYLDDVVDPGEYSVGPGDRFSIDVWGERPQHFAVTVTPEGSLIIPTVGEVVVTGKNLREVKSAVSRRLEEYYPHTVNSVTLTEVRRFRVTVTGIVIWPGMHTVSASTRASEVLAAAGLRTNASRRDIRLERSDRLRIVDLDRFERLGDREANPYLAEGDVLVVPARDHEWGTIEVSGAVYEPDRFEYASDDRVGDLLDLAYGLTPDADTTRIELWRFAPGSDIAERIEWPANTSYSTWRTHPLVADDRIVVRNLQGFRRKHSVMVTGEIQRPGRYIFAGDSISLRAVIDSAGGFTVQADLRHASITRAPKTALSAGEEDRVALIPAALRSRAEDDWLLADALTPSGRVVTDFVGLFIDGNEAFNVALVNRDEVHVPHHTASVKVMGRVVQPGLVAHMSRASLDYYLERAGGYAWQADKRRTFLVKGSTGATVNRSGIEQINAGDIIVIPTKRGKSLWTTLRETMVVMSSLATVYLVIDQATR